MFAALIAATLVAADHQTAHFLTTAPTAELARTLGDQAERLRAGAVRVIEGQPAPGPIVPIRIIPDGITWGITSSRRDGHRRLNLAVEVHGTVATIAADVLPHEVMHVALAQSYGVVPRWADEGLASLQETTAAAVEAGAADAPAWELLAIEAYPDNILGFYGDATSLTRFLAGRGGAPKLIRFALDADRLGMDQAATKHYGFADVVDLDRHWHHWSKLQK